MKDVKISPSYFHHFCLSLISIVEPLMKTIEDFEVPKTGVSHVNSISRAYEVFGAAK